MQTTHAEGYKADQNQYIQRMRFLTHNHQGELKAPLHRLSIHLVGEACKAHVSLQILLLLKTDRKTLF